MPITSRSEYGMRAMILLAEQPDNELLSAAELSRREHIPLKYLEQLLSELKKGGLVVSFPGARGGYRLARPAEQVHVGEIVRALDGAFAPMSCVHDGPERTPCAFEEGCRLKPLWSRLYKAVHGVLDDTSLASIAHGARDRSPLPIPPDEDLPEPPNTQCGGMFLIP